MDALKPTRNRAFYDDRSELAIAPLFAIDLQWDAKSLPGASTRIAFIRARRPRDHAASTPRANVGWLLEGRAAHLKRNISLFVFLLLPPRKKRLFYG